MLFYVALIGGFICLYFVVKQIRKIISSNVCVSDIDIHFFILNKLTEIKRNQVITHLGKCEKCQRRLEEFNNLEEE